VRFFLASNRRCCAAHLLYINNCSPPSVCIYYTMYVYITEKRNKTSSRELLLLKSDESATEWSFYSRAFRDEI
jgi:hypothetical protein